MNDPDSTADEGPRLPGASAPVVVVQPPQDAPPDPATAEEPPPPPDEQGAALSPAEQELATVGTLHSSGIVETEGEPDGTPQA